MSIENKWNSFLTENELKTVGVIACLDDEEQFLIIRRSNIDDRKGQWTLPGGHIDENDDSIEAGAIRELEEEANLSCKISDLKFLGIQNDKKHYFMTQKWSGEINVDKPNPETGEIEHDDYKWATIDDIKDIEDTEIPIYLLEKALEMAKNETDT
tara:strand:+ start:4220 stop:4684 length:465 start_codon:yes stop_codon:yes gene_type:complete